MTLTTTDLFSGATRNLNCSLNSGLDPRFTQVALAGLEPDSTVTYVSGLLKGLRPFVATTSSALCTVTINVKLGCLPIATVTKLGTNLVESIESGFGAKSL